MKNLIRHSIGKCQSGEPWPEAGNLALEARGSKSEEFNKALNRKVSVWGALARSWKSGSLEARGSKSEDFNEALNRKVSVWGALAEKVPSLPISFWHKNATTALGY